VHSEITLQQKRQTPTHFASEERGDAKVHPISPQMHSTNGAEGARGTAVWRRNVSGRRVWLRSVRRRPSSPGGQAPVARRALAIDLLPQVARHCGGRSAVVNLLPRQSYICASLAPLLSPPTLFGRDAILYMRQANARMSLRFCTDLLESLLYLVHFI
jgi:hypothetical protein